MFPFRSEDTRVRISVIAIISAALCTPGAPAQDEGARHIVRIEEDWVALIRVPDDATSAPQILNVIAPTPSMNGTFGMVELNHASFPVFQEGGLQLQAWTGETISDVAYSSEYQALTHDFDRLVYTVAMERVGHSLKFELRNGRSRTWGKFATTPLQTQVNVSDASLAGYDPEFSVANTNVNVGAHRVDLLYQKETRYYYSDGSTTTDDTARVIHRFRELVQFVSVEEYDSNEEYYNIDITE